MLGDRFEEALVFASRIHASQTRKGCETPYLSHLLSVAGLVLEHGGNEDEAMAAVLHDAIEDQGGAAMRRQLLEKFGPAVTAIVDGCTDTDQTPKPPWRKRKQDYIDHLAEASRSVRLVSAADKLHNARCILADVRRMGDAAYEKFHGGKQGTLWYYRSLVEAYRKADPVAAPEMVDELDRVISELEGR